MFPTITLTSHADKNSQKLNGFFTSTGVKDMQEENDFSTIDTRFPSLAAFIDRVAEHFASPVLSRVCTVYSDIVNHAQYGSTVLGGSSALGFSPIHRLRSLSRTAKQIFSALKDLNLLALRLHILHHVAKDLQRCGDFWSADASAFEQFSFFIKPFLKLTFPREYSSFDGAIQDMNSLQDFYQYENEQAFQNRAERLTRTEFWISLAGFQYCFISTINHLAKDENIFFKSYVMGHVQKSPRRLEGTPRRSNITLTVRESLFFDGVKKCNSERL